jgi:hypothetical protein
MFPSIGPNLPVSQPGIFSVLRVLSAQTGLTPNVRNKIVWDSKAVDANGWFDLATGLYKPQMPGIYQINLSVLVAPTSAADSASAAIYVNGVELTLGTFFAIGGGGTVVSTISTASMLLGLNGSTDTIEGYVYPSNGTVLANGVFTRMEGFFVGRYA